MPKPKKPKKQEEHSISTSLNNTFYSAFVGELVEIILEGPPSTTEIGIFPIVANGYLLEIDSEYVYLSDDAMTITRAVRKEKIITIDIVRQITETEQALMNVSIPEDKDNGN